jgi:hypothetical protein
MSVKQFDELIGKKFSKIEVQRGDTEKEDRIEFFLEDGNKYLMFHSQDCCEQVYIEDICGEIEDLVDSPILMAEEVSNSDDEEDCPDPDEHSDDSYTWTFYKFATIKGYVNIRWFGSSNGYYSESVDFVKEYKGE